MKKLEEAVIARLKYKGHNFEIYVDLEEALKVKEGKGDIKRALIIEEVYKDAKKGERVSENLLKEVFKTTDIYRVAEKIIREGDIQITTEYRRKLVEKKKRQIMEMIRKLAIDPKTNLPFTLQRIEEMLEKVKVHIDPFKPVEIQVNDIIKQIRKKFPIKIEISKLLVRIPYEYSKVINILKRKYKLLKEEWKDYGWEGIFEVPAGIKSEFFEDVGKLTKGYGEIKEL